MGKHSFIKYLSPRGSFQYIKRLTFNCCCFFLRLWHQGNASYKIHLEILHPLQFLEVLQDFYQCYKCFMQFIHEASDSGSFFHVIFKVGNYILSILLVIFLLYFCYELWQAMHSQEFTFSISFISTLIFNYSVKVWLTSLLLKVED